MPKAARRTSARLAKASPAKAAKKAITKEVKKTARAAAKAAPKAAKSKVTKKAPVAPKKNIPEKVSKKTLDLCLILDCTGSMHSWIVRSKETLN